MNPIVLNYAQCIKTEAHWGYDKFHNICAGTWHSVNWGSFDWTMAAVGISIFASLAAFGIVVITGMVAEMRTQEQLMKRFDF